MCGIVGILDLSGPGPINRQLLNDMNEVQHHRGPDAGGLHLEPGIGLGHRRLSIIDLSGGKQPMFNEDKSVVVTFNGEIYNFPNLHDELQALGHVFRTHSDTEVIVHAWEQWGEHCVTHFEGMFAFAVWDRNNKTLFLARDRLGKKPLHYSLLGNDHLIFSSELKALYVHPDLKREIDPLAVEEYFSLGYVADPRCIYKDIFKLLAGHTLTLHQGEARLPTPRQYWDLGWSTNNGSHSEPELTKELSERLRTVVKKRMIAEVPLGAFLSGGVDSSTVVAMMAGLSEQPINTCSIAFNSKHHDESKFAQMVADRYLTQHHVETVDPDDFSLLDKLAGIYDEPYADSSAIPTYRVCALARKRVTVALSGDGADEYFSGYGLHRRHLNEERLRDVLPYAIRKPLFGTLGRHYPKLDGAPRYLRAKSTFQRLARDSISAYFHIVGLISDDIRDQLYSSDFKQQLDGYNGVELFRQVAARSPSRHPLSMIQYIDLRTYLVGDILTKVDRASMANSLEVRTPLLDHTLLEWVFSLDPQLKLHGQQGKYILKKAMQPYLPNDVLYRHKMGFAVPLSEWFRGPLKERVRQNILHGKLIDSGMFNPKTLTRMVDEHTHGIREHGAPLWSLMMFESFLRNIDQG